MKVGDQVQLNSGGPLMTVNEITSSNYATCIWFPSMEKPVTYSFKIETLQLHEDDGSDD